MKELEKRQEIADGVFFTPMTDKKFKVSRISVVFLTKLSEDAAVNAVIPLMLTKCNSRYKTMIELNRRLSELYSASLDCNVSAGGDLQIIQLGIAVLSNNYALDGENVIREAAMILRDCIFSPYLEDGLFPAQSLEIEKQNQCDANDAEINDKANYTYIKAYEKACAGEPAERRATGTNDEIKAITPESAKNGYDKMISTYRTEIICAGESDFDEVCDIFSEAFRGVSRSPEESCGSKLSPLKAQPARFTEELEIEQGKLVMFFKTKSRDLFALNAMQAIYGGSEHSKLFNIVREKMSLCYYCFARLGYLKGFITTECGVDAENLEKAERECLNQLDEVKKGNFTEEDITKNKLYLINAIRAADDTIGGKMSRCLNAILDPQRAYSVDEWIKKLEEVTKERIIEAANSVQLDTVYILSPVKENIADE